MMSMAVSELTVIGQVGTTIGLGLLFDTLVVRSFMTPSIAALLGKWFWWPQRVPAAAGALRRGRKPPQQFASRRGMKEASMKRVIGRSSFGGSGIGVGGSRAGRCRHRFHQRAAHLRHLRAEGLQRLDRQDHLQAVGQRPRRRCEQVGRSSSTMQLVKDSTTEQAWQFLGAALRIYCPDKMPILAQAAQ